MRGADEQPRSTAESGGTLIEVMPQHRFDEAALWRYLGAHLPGFSASAQLRQFQGGQSNPTYLIETAGAALVLRKKPPGKLLPSAHLIEREYRVLQALGTSPVPVPAVRLLCEDVSVIGTAFYVMDYVAGRVLSAVALPSLEPSDRNRIYDDYARIAAALHAVDYRACGLSDFGKPEGYVARQLERWTRQYAASATGENRDFERLIEWLREHLPTEEETAIVHGDLRLGNMVVHPAEPRIVAVLDWELATLGHPLSDLAYACMSYHIPASLDGARGLEGLDLPALGIPPEETFIALYCRYAGRERIEHWPFFLAFSCFRMAAIVQGVYARALQGNAADQRAIEFGELARQFAATGLRVAAS